MNVAKDLGVTQYIMVTSLGTGKIGFPASKCHRFCPIQIGFAQFKQVLPNSSRFCPIKTGFAQFNRLWLSHFSVFGKVSGDLLYLHMCVLHSDYISRVVISSRAHIKMAEQGRTLHRQAVESTYAGLEGWQF